MKTCQTCKRQYADETLSYCLDDGSRLTETYDSEATLVNPPRATSTDPTLVINATPRPSEPTLVVSPPPVYYPPSVDSGSSRRRAGIGVGIGLAVLLVLIIGGIGVGAVVWLMQPGASVGNRNTMTPTETPNPTPRVTPTPTPEDPGPVLLTGRWYGNWRNSKGDHGNTTITIIEYPDGGITGGEGGQYVMTNGRRDGNVLTWEYVDLGDGCIDYKCRFDVDETGTVGHGTYEVTNSCLDQTFTGWYVEYKKQ